MKYIQKNQTITGMLLMVMLLAIPLFADEAVDQTPTVRIEKNVDYLGADRKEKADLYFPAMMQKNQRYPAVLIIHGGGWSHGDKAGSREINIGTNLAQHGYIGMSINYVLASKGHPTWPQNLHECKTAVRWLRKMADELSIDPDHIGVIGGSAGGHLSAMVSLTDAADKLDPQSPYSKYSCKVQAGVVMYGCANMLDRQPKRRVVSMLPGHPDKNPEFYRQASPMHYVDRNDPPILILHGTADKIVRPMQSYLLAQTMKDAGATYQLIIIEGAKHTFDLQPPQQDLRPVVFGFFDKYLKPTAQ